MPIIWELASVDSETVRYRAMLSELKNASGLSTDEILSTIRVRPPLNAGDVMPSGEIGLPIAIWTESFVRGDVDAQGVYGSKYGIEASTRLETWIISHNTKPFVTTAERSVSVLIPEGAAREDLGGEVIYRLADLFDDSDYLDRLEYQIVIPKSLRGIIEYDRDLEALTWAQGAIIDDSQAGSYRIRASAFDTNYALGDKSAQVGASLLLNIRDSSALSLDFFQDEEQLKLVVEAMFSILDPSASAGETSNYLDIGHLLLSIPSVSLDVKSALATNDTTTILNLLKQVAPVYVPSAANSSLMLVSIDAGDGDEVSVLDITAERIDQRGLEQLIAMDGFELGLIGPKISFDVKSNVSTDLGENVSIGYSVVNVRLPSSLDDFTGIIKTRLLDEKELGYEMNIIGGAVKTVDIEEVNALNDFALYGYGLDGLDSSFKIDFKLDDPLFDASRLVQSGLSDFGDSWKQAFAGLDGSAYLLDVTGDGKADILRMLLLDNGFFDGDLTPGLIYDPLIPVQLNLQSLPAQALGGFSFGSASGIPRDSGVEDSTTSDVVDGPRMPAVSDVSPSASDPSASASAPSPESSSQAKNQVTRILPIAGADKAQSRNINYFDRGLIQSSPSNIQSRPLSTTLSVGSGRSVGESALPLDGISSLNDATDSEVSAQPSSSLARPFIRAGIRSLAKDLAGAFDSFVAEMRDGLNTVGIGGLLLGALVGPASVSSASQLLLKQDFDKQKLRKASDSLAQVVRVRLLDANGRNSEELHYENGALSIHRLVLQPQSANTNQNLVVCAGNLEQLLAATDQPGHALRALEDVLIRLFRTPSQDPIAYQWDSWLEALASHHQHPSKPQLAKKASIAKLKLQQQIQHAEKTSPMLSNLYMAAEVLRCYRSLGGHWPV